MALTPHARARAQDYSRKDTFRDLAEEWEHAHADSAHMSEKRVMRVRGEGAAGRALEDRDAVTGALRTSMMTKATAQAKAKMKHQRMCQGCKMTSGVMLFCSRCPIVMHK